MLVMPTPDIYKDNKEDIEAATHKYLSDYAKYIYVGPRAKVTKLTGQHLKYMAVSATESVAGGPMVAWGRSVVE